MGLKIEIQLERVTDSYLPGAVMVGNVVVAVTKGAKLIRGVKLKILGKAKTHWAESTGKYARHYKDKEVYIDKKIHLVGYGNVIEKDNHKMTIQEGIHSYPFNYRLPDGIPCSFSYQGPDFISKKGYIKYTLVATVSRIWRPNCKSKIPFSVQGILNLNLEPGAAQLGQISGETVVPKSWCGSPSGKVGFNLKLSKTGFVPGEKIAFSVHMFNPSNRGVDCTLALIQELTLYGKDTQDSSRTYAKTKSLEIEGLTGPTLLPKHTRDCVMTSDDSVLVVPLHTPPSRLDGCRIIDVCYRIEMKMNARFVNLKKDLPILIGTIPLTLRDDSSVTRALGSLSIPGDRILTLTSTPAQLSSFSASSRHELGLPTYQEAVGSGSCSVPPNYGYIDMGCRTPKTSSYEELVSDYGEDYIVH